MTVDELVDCFILYCKEKQIDLDILIDKANFNISNKFILDEELIEELIDELVKDELINHAIDCML